MRALAWAILDKADASTANTLGAEVMPNWPDPRRSRSHPPKGLVIRSGKAAGFIAGADIEEFTRIDTPAGAGAGPARLDLFNRLAAVRYPTLALVRGHCMGGGTGTGAGLPLPHRGGRARHKFGAARSHARHRPRLGRHAAPAAAGRPGGGAGHDADRQDIDAKRAKKMGLADDCVPPRVMDNAARMLVLSGKRRAACQLPLLQRC
jgi:3-hydroxyacyl-CoA dehydrogenase/enoyl-CoA hydratase/3-hydroxybutyryl-CoA epimerase